MATATLDTVTTTIEGPERVLVSLDSSYELGEGSLYAHQLAAGPGYLHVDILGHTCSVHRPEAGGATVTYRLPGPVGTVVPVANGKQLLVALATGPAFVDLATGRVTPVAGADVEAHLPGNRANDGKAGPDGRFYYGTMARAAGADGVRPTSGALYVMDHDGSVRRLLDGVNTSNGLAWSADAKLF